MAISRARKATANTTNATPNEARYSFTRVSPEISFDWSTQNRNHQKKTTSATSTAVNNAGPAQGHFSLPGAASFIPLHPRRGGRDAAVRMFDNAVARRLACRVMRVFKKKNLADIVIFIGMAVNVVVILLILYFYVI